MVAQSARANVGESVAELPVVTARRAMENDAVAHSAGMGGRAVMATGLREIVPGLVVAPVEIAIVGMFSAVMTGRADPVRQMSKSRFTLRLMRMSSPNSSIALPVVSSPV